MSYEGYYQCVCENRHYTKPPEDYSGQTLKCSICKAKLAFVNPVDDTNHDEFGCIPEEEFERILGFVHEARYTLVGFVPTPAEAEELRKYRSFRNRELEWQIVEETPLCSDDH